MYFALQTCTVYICVLMHVVSFCIQPLFDKIDDHKVKLCNYACLLTYIYVYIS